jgi:Thioredoxin like C-terminal domain
MMAAPVRSRAGSDNHYWPALYFADRSGAVVDFHFGEGRYEESEQTLQRLLGIKRDPIVVSGHGVEAAADWDHLRTPETYLGEGRGQYFASPGGARPGRHAYDFPTFLEFNHWALDGNGVLTDGRLYQLVRQPGAIQERTLELTFLEPGAEAYSFTFG